MIPTNIVRYLQERKIPFTRHWHARAVEAQRLAQSLHASGKQVAKVVLADIDGQATICVLPASLRLDESKLTEAMNAKAVRLLSEEDFGNLFPECEVGAEPPFGRLYKLPVILDASFQKGQRLMFRAGSHEETLEMGYDDYIALEEPTVTAIGRYQSPMPKAMRPESAVAPPP